VDPSLGDVDALFVIAHQASLSVHPSEGSFDHPAPRQTRKAGRCVGSANNLDDEVEEGRFVHQLGACVGNASIRVYARRATFLKD